MNKLRLACFILFLSILINPALTYAKGFLTLPGDSIPHYKLSLQLDAESLRSTHKTYFKGFSAAVSFPLSKTLTAGMGFERTTSAFHPDNNWNLYNLRFAPVYLSEEFRIFQIRSFHLYSEARQGISFIKYNKEEFKVNPGVIYPVKERGLYGYAGVGAGWNFLKKFYLKSAVGFKAYHISKNDQDVNPHGINYQLGLKYSFAAASK